MDSELSIDEIVSALHLSLEETLKVSLGPFIDKFNSSRDQFIVVSDLLKQLPEYKELIKQNTILINENASLKNYIKTHCKTDKSDNHIQLKIMEREQQSDKEQELEAKSADVKRMMELEEVGAGQDYTDSDEEIEVQEEEEVHEEEVQEEEQEKEEVQEEEVQEEEQEEEEVQEEEQEEEEVVEEEQEEEVVEEEQEEEVEVQESEDDEISNNDSSQIPRMIVKSEEASEEEEEEEGELYEVDINGKEYFVDDDENGNIYKKISDEEPSDEPIGILKDGVPTFF